ncbi:hypothetical protein [Amylolactobacillus amylophilus]|uniref:hypothetical protein n=1 Tax=Amylolactobacillus amylophilus TaxID=1603 RepID=UPI0006CF57D4|nr:hypothetical protein [Amylolactobacillus amylophilus]
MLKKYNNNLDNLVNATKNAANFAISLEKYKSSLLSSALEAIPKVPEPETSFAFALSATILLVGVLAITV